MEEIMMSGAATSVGHDHASFCRPHGDLLLPCTDHGCCGNDELGEGPDGRTTVKTARLSFDMRC